MKKGYIFSFLIVLVSAALLAGCGKKNLITAISDAPEYSIQILDAKNNNDIYGEENKYKINSGTTIKIAVSFKEGWDPTQAKLFAGDKELTLTKDNAFPESEIWFAELKIGANINIEVRNLVKKVYTVKMPTSPEMENYIFYNGTTPISAETLTVEHGNDLTITVFPKYEHYALPNYLPYHIGDVFDYDNNQHYAIYPETDLYGKPIFHGSALKYKFSDITSNFAIDLSSLYMPNESLLKRIKLDLPNYSEYEFWVSVKDDNGELKQSYSSYDYSYNKDLYISFNETYLSDYVKNLDTKTIIVEGNNETFEYPMETEGEYKDYFIIPAVKVKSDLKIRLKEKAVDETSLQDGKYYGTFDNNLSNQIPDRLGFTKGNVNGFECYTFEGKVYLIAGDSLFIPRKYGDNFTVTTTNITLNKEMHKSSNSLEDYDYIKYTVISIESNDFTIELSTSSAVTIPYADLKDDFTIEYRIGYDSTLPFTEITGEESAIIIVDNLQPLIIKLTSKHSEPFWANFDLSISAYVYNLNNFMAQNYLSCKVEERVGANQLYPKDGIYFYTVAWFAGNTEISAR